MLKIIIRKTGKSAMQSGQRAREWIVEFVDDDSKKYLDPMMGWIGSNSTKSTMKLKFSTKKLATEYAKKQNLLYEIYDNEDMKQIKKSYSDKFCKPLTL